MIIKWLINCVPNPEYRRQRGFTDKIKLIIRNIQEIQDISIIKQSKELFW